MTTISQPVATATPNKPQTLADLVARVRAQPAAPATPQPAPLDRNGTSPTLEQLRDLAGRLHGAQPRIGDALAKMLSGEPFLDMAQTGRNALALEVAWVLRGEFPDLDPADVAMHCTPGIEACEALGSKMTVAKFESQLARGQDKPRDEDRRYALMKEPWFIAWCNSFGQRWFSANDTTPGAYPQPAADRLAFVYSEDKEHDAIDIGVQALAGSARVFQRAGLLVQVARDRAPSRGDLAPADADRICEVRPAALREELGRRVAWFRQLRSTNAPCRVPQGVVEGVQAREEWEGIRKLRGLAEAPIVRPDGSIAAAPGYDERTGVYIAGTVAAAEIAAFANASPAESATWLLDELVSDFPFAKPAHRSAWLAALLTPLARYAFVGPTPLILIDKNQPGSGGSLLADLIGIACTGRHDLSRVSQAQDEAEEIKRLLGLAVAGDPVVLIDNISGPLGNGALDRALTGTSLQDRWLGGNKIVTAPWNCLVLATGNNVQLVGDTVRRALHVRLESLEERPEERAGFRHGDIKSWARENRSLVLGAALRILSAHVTAGAPAPAKAWGSFEAWSRVVRGAVLGCGLPDPIESRDAIVEADSDRDTCGAVVEGLVALGAVSEATALPIKTVLQRLPAGVGGPSSFTMAQTLTPELEAMRGALEALDAKLDPTRLGYSFRKYRGRVVDRRRLIRSKDRKGVARWYAEQI